MSKNLPAKRNGGKTGRPRSLEVTPELCTQVEALAGYLTQAQIADHLGITDRTLREYFERDEALSSAYARGRAGTIKDIAGNLCMKARGDNMRAAEFYLKTQAGWSETSKVEHSGELGIHISVTKRLVSGDADD